MSARHMTARGTAVALGAGVLLWGCATTPSWLQGPASGSAWADSLAAGVEALKTGEYPEASTRLHGLAARCEAGRRGETAVLLLATASLDPRNPEASPDEAARLAGRFLGLPRVDPADAAVAETLLLLALDRGAGIPSPPDTLELEGSGPVRGIATRFHDCGSGRTPDGLLARPLPELPGAPAAVLLERLRTQRDSLSQRVTELEAELQRIRGLLQEGLPPDTGSSRP